MRTRYLLTSAFALAALCLGTAAHASNLLVNGDFETGDYTGWTTSIEAGSSGGLTVVANNGGSAPISGFPVSLNASGGGFFSISDQSGPGSYALTQAFTLGGASILHVSFDQFLDTFAAAEYDNGRDYLTDPNENAVVDILAGTADPFTDAPGDIVRVLFGPGVGLESLDDIRANPWIHYAETIALPEGTYQIRFAETDNRGYFQQGVDNVSLEAAPGVPEPATWTLMIGGFGLAGAALRRRRSVVTA